VQEGGIEPDIRVPQLSDPDAAKRAQYGIRESDLRGHLINEVDLEDEALEADRREDPRFTLTSAQLEQQGIKDFQLDYALRTLRRTGGAVVASRG
jgi:carboxyl-terminal processing protease